MQSRTPTSVAVTGKKTGLGETTVDVLERGLVLRAYSRKRARAVLGRAQGLLVDHGSQQARVYHKRLRRPLGDTFLWRTRHDHRRDDLRERRP